MRRKNRNKQKRGRTCKQLEEEVKTSILEKKQVDKRRNKKTKEETSENDKNQVDKRKTSR